jgi:hypothetical protein
MVEIKEVVDGLCKRYGVRAQSRMDWLARSLERFPYFDGALSLILCLATNIRTIHLDESKAQPLLMTRHILNNWMTYSAPPETFDSDRPFQKLDVLQISSVDDSRYPETIPIFPNLRIL